jgi:hypothetical protein
MSHERSKRQCMKVSKYIPGQKGSTDFFLFYYLGSGKFSDPLYFSSSERSMVKDDVKMSLKPGDFTEILYLNKREKVMMRHRGTEAECASKYNDAVQMIEYNHWKPGEITPGLRNVDCQLSNMSEDDSYSDSDDSDGLKRRLNTTNGFSGGITSFKRTRKICLTESPMQAKRLLNTDNPCASTSFNDKVASKNTHNPITSSVEHMASSNLDENVINNSQIRPGLKNATNNDLSLLQRIDKKLDVTNSLLRQGLRAFNKINAANELAKCNRNCDLPSEHFDQFDSGIFTLDDLPKSNDPAKFLYEFIKRVKEPSYITMTIIEPRKRSERRAASLADIQLFKRKLMYIFCIMYVQGCSM